MKKINIAFLDRDGVINLKNFNNGYIGLLKHFRWVKGAIKAIKFLNKKNYKVVVVTNLAPRKMRGIESNGMILMAEDENGKLVFVSSEVSNGSNVS